MNQFKLHAEARKSGDIVCMDFIEYECSGAFLLLATHKHVIIFLNQIVKWHDGASFENLKDARANISFSCRGDTANEM